MRSEIHLNPGAAPARASMPGLVEKSPLKGTQCPSHLRVGFSRLLWRSPGIDARAGAASTMKRLPCTILLSLFLTLPALASEQWYVVSLAGQPVGSLQETISEDPAGNRTESRMQMVLNRLGSRVEMETASAVQESADGRIQKGQPGPQDVLPIYFHDG
jgi:hypothetical protein